MTESFKVGDVVRLKGQKPMMNVMSVLTPDAARGSGPIRCCWFTAAGTLDHGGFFPEMLERVPR